MSGHVASSGDVAGTGDRQYHLADLKEKCVYVGFGNFGKGSALGYGGQSIIVSGLWYTHGLSTHPPSNGVASVEYDMPAGVVQLVTGVALNDDRNRSDTPLTFEIIDCSSGSALWSSQPVQTNQDTQLKCIVDIEGVQRLRLLVRCPGFYGHAHAVWLDPTLHTEVITDVVDKVVAESNSTVEVGHRYYLADLTEECVRVGYGRLGKGSDLGYEGELICVSGQRYVHSLSTHPASHGTATVEYNLPAGVAELCTGVGLNDDRARSDSPLTFAVVDCQSGKVLWKSRSVQVSGDRQMDNVIDVSGVARIRLLVNCPGSFCHAHAVWLDPVLLPPKLVVSLSIENDSESSTYIICRSVSGATFSRIAVDTSGLTLRQCLTALTDQLSMSIDDVRFVSSHGHLIDSSEFDKSVFDLLQPTE